MAQVVIFSSAREGLSSPGTPRNGQGKREELSGTGIGYFYPVLQYGLNHSHRIHVWYIHVGKYTIHGSYDPMGLLN